MRKNVCLKVLSLGLAALLIISLGGCGKKEEVKKTTADSFKEVTPEAKAEETMKAFSNDTPYGYGVNLLLRLFWNYCGTYERTVYRSSSPTGRYGVLLSY